MRLIDGMEPVGKAYPLFSDEALEAPPTIEKRPVKVEDDGPNAFKHLCFHKRAFAFQRGRQESGVRNQDSGLGQVLAV